MILVKKGNSGKAKGNGGEAYKTIFENLPFVAFTLDRDGRVLEANEYTEKLTGLKAKDVINKKFSELGLLGKKDMIRAFLEFRKNLQGKVTEKTIYTLRLKDGGELLLELIGIPIRENGRVIKVLDVGSDVTERSKEEGLIKSSEESYRSLIELAPNGIISTNLKGVVTSCNLAFVKLTGFGKDEIVGKHFTQLPTLNKRDIPNYIKLFSSILRGKIPEPFKFEWKKRDGSVRLGEINIGLIKSSNKLIGVQAFVSDITERKAVEDRIRESEQKYRFLVDSMQEMAFILSKTGHILFANRATLKSLGYSEEEVVGKSITAFLTKGSLKQAFYALAQEFLGKHQKEMEIEAKSKNGEIRTLLIAEASNPVHEMGKMVGILVNARDITERKRATVLLQESEAHLKEAQSLGRIGSWEFDVKKQTIVWSEETYVLYERDPELGPPSPEEEARYYSVEQAKTLRDYAARAIKTGERFSYDLAAKLPSGRTAYLAATMRPIKDERGRVVKLFGTVQNITERKKVEEELRENEERYKTQFEEALDAIFISDAETGILVECNRAATELVERSKSELIGQHQRILHPPEEIRGQFSETFKKHLTEVQGQTLEAQVITKSGKLKHVNIKANIIEIKGKKLLQGIFRDITEREKAEEAIKKRTEELEAFNKLSVGRELKMVELKKRISELENQLREKSK